MIVDAFHLPGLTPDDVSEWTIQPTPDDDIAWRVPVLTPGAITRSSKRLRAARAAYLKNAPTADILRAIDRVAHRLRAPHSDLRNTAESILPAVTGYSTQMVGRVLDRFALDWTEESLSQLLATELPADLGHWIAPQVCFHVFSGNVPGVAVNSLVRSLLVRAATLGKTARGEPILPVLFARAIAEENAELGQCIAITYWPGGTAATEAEALESSDAVVFYGGHMAALSLRERTPANVLFVEHGPRISFGMVGRDALQDVTVASRTAERVATATAWFDQQGCVSPQLVYVEESNTDARTFARFVAQGLAALQHTLPRGQVSIEEASAIRELRAAAEFRAIAGHDVALFGSDDTNYTVICDADARFEASPLNRFLRIKQVTNLSDVPALIAPFRELLQTVALEGAGERQAILANQLEEVGVTRITDFERMPWPEPWAIHDGRGPLRELLRPVGA